MDCSTVGWGVVALIWAGAVVVWLGWWFRDDMTPIDPQQQAGRTGRPARRFRIGMEPIARAVLAERERDEAEAKLQAAEQRADALAVSLADVERCFVGPSGDPADGWQQCLICGSVWSEDDDARVKSECPLDHLNERWRALGGAAGAQGAGES